MDLPKYTTILHDVRVNLGLSMNEYAVADMIYKLSTNPKGSIQGWCYASKPYIGKVLGLSEQSIHTIIRSLTNAGLIEKDPDTKYLRATEKWYNAAVVSNFSHTKETLASADTETTKESLVPLKVEAKESLASTTQESLVNSNIQDIEKDNITSPNGEEQQAADNVKSDVEVLEGEITNLPKMKTSTGKRQEPNPDGTYGDPRINSVHAYFLEITDLDREDCTQRESRMYWKKLLDEVKQGDPVEGVKKLIAVIPEDEMLAPNITSSKALYYKKGQLLSRYRARKAKEGLINQGNVRGGVAW